MKTAPIEGKRIVLKRMTSSEADVSYVEWLNDKTINQYLESRFVSWTLSSVRKYVVDANKDQNTLLFGIYINSTGKLIGTIKLSLNLEHQTGEIGLLIGDKNEWGKGIATEAIDLIVKFAFQNLKLHKLTAGAYATNFGSIKAFQKNGFVIEGVKKEQYLSEKKYIDGVFLGLINS